MKNISSKLLIGEEPLSKSI